MSRMRAKTICRYALQLPEAGGSAPEWRARPRPGQPTQLPRWLDTVEHMRPLAASGTGFVLYAANPKNLTVGLSAAVAFASLQLPKGDAFIVAAIYVLVAASPIVIPVLGYFIAEDQVRPWLTELQA